MLRDVEFPPQQPLYVVHAHAHGAAYVPLGQRAQLEAADAAARKRAATTMIVQIIQRPARIIYKKKKKNLFIYLQNVIAVFVFSDSRCKIACNCLQICVHVFINRPQNCAHADLVSFACWIGTLCHVCITK